MKKLLGIIVLGLLLSANAYAEITIKKCHRDYQDKFEKQKMEAWYFLINESKKTINNVRKYKKSFVKKTNDKYKSEGNSYRMNRIYISEYKLTYMDDDYAKGESEFIDIIIDLNDKTVQLDATTLQCK
jgi:hypothetical protein